MAQPHRMTVRVRYPEADPMGRLHHATYAVYFEMGRTELLRERGLAYRDMEAAGRYIAVAHVDCRYRAPARYDEELAIETWVERVRGARVVFGNRLLRSDPDGETVIAEARITGALVDASGRPQRFSDEEVALLAGRVG